MTINLSLTQVQHQLLYLFTMVRQPHLALSVSDCKNLLYYLEPHEKTCGVTGITPEPYESIEKMCNYCRQRVNNSRGANSDGYMFDEYYEENLL